MFENRSLSYRSLTLSFSNSGEYMNPESLLLQYVLLMHIKCATEGIKIEVCKKKKVSRKMEDKTGIEMFSKWL